MSAQILIVEDEKPIREMIRMALEDEGYRIDEAENARTAYLRIGDNRPDLLLVDWMLPDYSGIELIRKLRKDEFSRTIPMMMMTARDAEGDKITGLDSGADDYMTKPVAIKELRARIKALLRRSSDFCDEELLRDGALTLDLTAFQLLINEQSVHIGQTEFNLLKFFMTHQNRVFSRTQLLDYVWGHNVYVEERTIDVHILRLRKALKPHGLDKLIQTVRGAGYRYLKADAQLITR